MDNIYGWFTPEDINLFSLSYGYMVGFIIFLFFSLLTTVIYYLIVGRSTDSYSKIEHWLLFALLNSLLIFLATLSIIGFKLKENIALEDIHIEIWIFSLINAIGYGLVSYFILSLILNNFSTYNKYTPFNLFK